MVYCHFRGDSSALIALPATHAYLLGNIAKLKQPKKN